MRHEAHVHWELRDGDDMVSGRYSRAHTLRFDGGAEVTAAPSPDIVPEPWTDAAAVDPEEMLVAAISNCHMLWFLDLARRDGWVVQSYDDHAIGNMTKNAAGALWVSRVTLDPHIQWVGAVPTSHQIADLHHRAHEACFIANSVRTEIVLAGQD